MINARPLVSVAIVTYNHRDFVRECLDSILAQDHRPLEIVVADDASTDGTQDILRDYEARHPGLFVLRLATRNAGITANCNAAHFSCTGKYIAWIGGDDVMLPGKISAQVEDMEAHPECALSYHDLEVFDSASGRILGSYPHPRDRRQGGQAVAARHGAFNGACATMVRRVRTPVHGYDARVRIASDWLYWVQCLDDGGTIRYLPRTLGRYRRHGNNVTDLRRKACLEDHLISCALLLTEHPELHDDLKFRMSRLLEDIGRDEVSPRRGGTYLDASLRFHVHASNVIRRLHAYAKRARAAVFRARKPG